MEMTYGVMKNAPGLLLEFKDRLLQLFESGEAVTIENDSFSAPATDKGFCFLKFGDELFSLVAALGARYQKRGFVVPASFERK